MTLLILSNILRTKVNQTMKYGQLIEYNLRNIFLEYHTQTIKPVPDSL